MLLNIPIYAGRPRKMCAVLNQERSHELAKVAGLCLKCMLYTESAGVGEGSFTATWMGAE